MERGGGWRERIKERGVMEREGEMEREGMYIRGGGGERG